MKTNLPHNLEAERALLGYLLNDESETGLKLIVEARIGHDDFYDSRHALIFDQIRKLSQLKRPIHLVSLSDALDTAGNLARAGNPEYIASLTDGIPMGTTSGLSECCRIVKRDSEKRQAVNLALKILTISQNGTNDLAAELEEPVRTLQLITNKPAQPREESRPDIRGSQCPTIPTDAWHGISRFYLDAVKNSTEASDNFHLASFLTVAGSILGKSVYYLVANRLIFPNLYTVIVGDSAWDRKDSAMDLALELAERVNPAVTIGHSLDSWEGLVEVLYDVQQEKSSIWSFTLALTEMGMLIDKAEMKGVRNIVPNLCKAFDVKRPLSKLTAIEPKVLKDTTSFSILAGTTTKALYRINPQDLEMGLGNRFIYVPGIFKPDDNYDPPPPDPEYWNPLSGKLTELLEYWRSRASTALPVYPHTSGSFCLTLSASGKEAYKEYYRQLRQEAQDNPLVRTLIGRHHIYCLKIALIWAALDRKEMIEEWHIAASIAFMNFLYPALYYVFRSYGVSRWAEEDLIIIEAVRAAGGRISASDLYRNRFQRRGKGVFDKHLEQLTKGADAPIQIYLEGRETFLRLRRNW